MPVDKYNMSMHGHIYHAYKMDILTYECGWHVKLKFINYILRSIFHKVTNPYQIFRIRSKKLKIYCQILDNQLGRRKVQLSFYI